MREIDQLFDDWWGREGKKGGPGHDAAVKEYLCWLRDRIGTFDPDHKDKWWAYDRLEQAAREVRLKLRTRVEPVLSRLKTRSGLIALWDETSGGDIGWRREPRTPLGFALLLKQVDRNADADRIVQRVCIESRGQPFHTMVEAVAEALGLKCVEGN